MTRTLIEQEAQTLTKMNVSELYQWAKKHHFSTGKDFVQFKKALLGIGIDYDKKRRLERNPLHRAVNLRHAVPKIIWCVGVDLDTDRFAISTDDGTGVWISDFEHETQKEHFYEITLRKAIWLASTLANKAEHKEAFMLQLHVDRYWTRHAKNQASWAEPISKLNKYARDSGIGLDIRSVNGNNNPANILLTEITVGEHKNFDHRNFLETLNQP